MIKKILCIILCLLILCGCSNNNKFVKVEKVGRVFGYQIYLVYDRDTDVMYLVSRGISPYYNSNGEIMTYTEYCKEKSE